jgi:hypothetical protein
MLLSGFFCVCVIILLQMTNAYRHPQFVLMRFYEQYWDFFYGGHGGVLLRRARRHVGIGDSTSGLRLLSLPSFCFFPLRIYASVR